ncbi:hypothetical protein JHK85_054122 [Glycine max]|nr:hypothetical protein JHK85_054122 [Glycine max]
MLFENLSCNSELDVVDLSSNLLTGSLPRCLVSNSSDSTVLYARNCLDTTNQNQQPQPFCHTEALAVGILPETKKHKQVSKVVLSLGIVGGTLGGVALVLLVFFIVRRGNDRSKTKNPPTRLISENAASGYISQTKKLGAVGLPTYRSFSLEEIESATNYFDTASLMGEDSYGKMYRGQLKNGSLVAIRCVEMKKRHSTQNFVQHIELISKLRHRHLVSAIGHCFECSLDDSSVSKVFLVFEYVPNGTLRNWISDEHARKSFSWTQRIGAAIGVAKGIQFLHTGIVPGVYSNDLKIEDVLLDQNLVAKISSYHLPLLSNMGKLQASLGGDEEGRRGVVDPAFRKACLDQSLKTMMEICVRCLVKEPADRPSIEDVLWNLQFASQVQDAWRGDSQIVRLSSPQAPSSVQPPLPFILFQLYENQNPSIPSTQASLVKPIQSHLSSTQLPSSVVLGSLTSQFTSLPLKIAIMQLIQRTKGKGGCIDNEGYCEENARLCKGFMRVLASEEGT